MHFYVNSYFLVLVSEFTYCCLMFFCIGPSLLFLSHDIYLIPLVSKFKQKASSSDINNQLLLNFLLCCYPLHLHFHLLNSAKKRRELIIIKHNLFSDQSIQDLWHWEMNALPVFLLFYLLFHNHQQKSQLVSNQQNCFDK